MARGSLRIPPAVIAGAVVALAAKLLLASTTFGTTDVRAFLGFLLQDQAGGPVSVYEKYKDFNHPPSMLPVLAGMHRLAEATGISFSFWLRLPAILADLGSLALVASCFQPARGFGRTAFLLAAAAPVSVLVSGFHGNTDPVMIFLVLASIALLERSKPAWLAGLVLGLALDVKVVPLVFGPAILLAIPGWRRRIEYFGAALLVVAATWAPVFLAAPDLVARRVLGYGSRYGEWGLSRLLVSSDLFRDHGKILLAAAIVVLSVWMNRRAERTPLFRQVAVVAFAFLALSPGFGIQYLAWLVPFTVLLPAAASVSFHAASGAFLVAVYTFWCQTPPGPGADPDWLGADFWSRGLPWDIGNAHKNGSWRGPLVILEVACWISVVAAFACLLRSTLRASAGGPARGSA